MTMLTPYLSIVIPAYNEENRIGRTLKETFDYLDQQNYDSEVIVVNDGSRDHTIDKVREFEPRGRGRLRLIENPGNRGKGYSVRNGMLHARGEIALFYDADLSTPTSEIIKVIEPIAADQFDVVFGSRMLNYELIGTHQSFLRELRGRGGNLFLRVMLDLQFKDTQCGFKAFRRETVNSVFPLQRINGWGFDIEILFITQKQGWRLLETPVKWDHVDGSKVTILGSTINVLMEVMTIRINDLTGKYDSALAITKA